MLRAMDSAVAGLRAHQNKLDVIGNNIANVNTFGFKAQNFSFKEAMYQTSTSSTMGSNTAGGVNPAQSGYGTMTVSYTHLGDHFPCASERCGGGTAEDCESDSKVGRPGTGA